MEESRPYTNTDIDRFHLEIKDALTRIEAQTTKTNGRVNRLEIAILCIIFTTIGFIGKQTLPLILNLIL